MTVTRGGMVVDWRLPEDFRIHTARLDLIPARQEHLNTESQSRTELSRLLNARVAEHWPPEIVPDRDSDGTGWWDWYVVTRDSPSVLIGVCGIKGWPSVSQSVQTGCAFLEEFQGQGYGKEAVDGLVSWVLQQPGVERVLAEVSIGNAAAIGILRRLGFDELDLDAPAQLLRFAKNKK